MEIIVRSPFLKQYTDVLEVVHTNAFSLISRHQMLAQNALIRDLVDAGAWVDMSNLIVLASDGSGDFNRVDLRTPSNTLLGYSGGLTFRNNIGWQGNGSNGRIRVNNLVTAATNNYFLAKSYDNVAGGSGRLFGGRSGAASNTLYMVPRSGSNQLVYTNNTPGNLVANSDSSGYYVTCADGTNIKAYKNTTLMDTATIGAGLVNNLINLLADYVSGADTSYSAYTIQVFISGNKNLESLNGTIQTIFNNYLSKL